MKPELISFDAAGTLIEVDWRPGHFATRCALDSGLELDEQIAEEIYDRLVRTRWQTYCAINRTRNDEACDAFWHDVAADWLEHMDMPPTALAPILKLAADRLYGPHQTTFRLFPEVAPMLQDLREEGWRMVVLSNWDYSLHRILRNLGISDYFELVFASLQEGPEKPDPALFSIVSERMGVAPGAILHVGDHPVDDLQGTRDSGWQALLLDRSRDGSAPPILSSLSQMREALAWIG
jgi:putative hydrolase of the HAD superfamily